jgi:cell division protein FtsI/penicillin-binding protein 2
LSGNKMPLGATEINIVYPDYYQGRFDDKQIEVNVGGKSIPVTKANWDKEKRTVQITFDKRLQTKQEVEIVLSNVQNPDSGGIFYFDCQIKSSAAFPLARYAGTWILSIN